MLNHLLLILMLGTAWATAQEEELLVIDLDAPVRRRSIEGLPSGDEIMSRVRDRLAETAVRITAEISCSQGKDDPTTLQAEAELEWRASRAQYTLFTESGELLCELSLNWGAPGTAPEVRLKTSANEVAQPVRLSSGLPGLPLQWNDLSFSWLWWSGAEVHMLDNRKTRDCVVVDVPRPAWDDSPYAFLRLWIDRKESFLLIGEAYDASDKMVRKIEGKDLKKFGELWIPGNFIVRHYPDKTTTSVIVTDLEPLFAVPEFAPVQSIED